MRFLILCCTAMLLGVPAVCGPIATVTANLSGPISGVYTYSYQLDNIGLEPIADIALYFLAPEVPVLVEAPEGWTSVVLPGYIEWLSTDIPYDVAPGLSLSGFRLTSTFASEPAVLAPSSIDNATGEFIQGTPVLTIGPVAASQNLPLDL